MDWHHINTDLFWAEEAFADHVVQIYENDEILINSLGKFVSGGIQSGEPIIVIATEIHIQDLKNNIRSQGYDMESLQEQNLFIPLIATEVLAEFMINEWPDDALFEKTIFRIMEKVRHEGHKIRAFGEMVSLLWHEGLYGATIYLEHLWNKFCAKYPLCLFCAYPKKAFQDNFASSLQHICKSHSKMISRIDNGSNEIIYHDMADATMPDLFSSLLTR
ncbi:MAG TPA: MEDS domain-containing protein [Puia sp.]|nr:MEDS domain-containing protein [Puia sp.]